MPTTDPDTSAAPPPDDDIAAREDELRLELEHLRLKREFVAAKTAGDPDRYAAAKAAFGEHRRFWRLVGEFVGNRVPGATVTTPEES